MVALDAAAACEVVNAVDEMSAASLGGMETVIDIGGVRTWYAEHGNGDPPARRYPRRG
jgi:hypothetical protein